LKDAFSVVQKRAVAGKKVVIIDDVVTTGATLGECAKALKMAGAKHIIGLALART
jgi:predicted amidophosphoribosyltransferase